MGHQLRHLSYPGRQGAGVYRRRSGPPEELAGSIATELRVRVGFLDPIEVRADGEDPAARTLVGHAAVFDRMSEELGFAGLSFRERVRRGAFRRALDEDQDVRFLIEHDPRWPLARTRSGTLELSEDPRGLLTTARIDTRQTYAADLVIAIERRDVDQMSFGFTVAEDEWLERTHDDGTVEIVRDVVLVQRLYDVSAVTFPAYPQTDIAARSAALVVAGVELIAPDGGVYEDNLRAFARRDRHAPESVALQPAIDDALALLAKRRRALEVELVRDLPDATLWVQAGETRLRQVLGNLLANALDALSEKAPPRRIWISAEVTAEGVDLQLRDNGPGFSAQALQHAREPFFTTKTRTQGLGLGLAICETLMRALGGELLLANHPNGGALITLRLRSSTPGANLQPPEEFS